MKRSDDNKALSSGNEDTGDEDNGNEDNGNESYDINNITKITVFQTE